MAGSKREKNGSPNNKYYIIFSDRDYTIVWQREGKEHSQKSIAADSSDVLRKRGRAPGRWAQWRGREPFRGRMGGHLLAEGGGERPPLQGRGGGWENCAVAGVMFKKIPWKKNKRFGKGKW